MASGTITFDSSGAMRGQIVWESVADINSNTSSVTAKLQVRKGSAYSGTTGTFSGYLEIGSGSESDSYYGTVESDWVTVVSFTKTVFHNNDGSGSCYLYGEIQGPSGTTLAGVSVSGADTVDLDVIPRSSSFTCTGDELGSPLVFEISSESSSFTHTITYKCGTASGTICTKTSETEVSWTPPLDLAEQETSGTAVSITFELTAYNGASSIGKDTLTVNCQIPESVVPTLSVEIADASENHATYGAYLQSKSALSVKLAAGGIYGSTISSQQVKFDGKTYIGAENTTDAIKSSGTVQLVASAKDSRGRIKEVTVDIEVLPYEPPKVDSITVQRCDADGTANASGEYLIAVFDVTVTALNDKNSAAYTFQYKKSSDTTYTSVDISTLDGSYTVTGHTVIFAADKNDSYNILLTITDNFGSTQKNVPGASQLTLLSRFKNGMGYAIGKIAERLGYLDMGFHIHMNGNRLHGLPDPTDEDEAVTVAYAKELIKELYPQVGDYYITENETSPAERYGGTWERLEDVFLLAAGGTYALGATGGEATHTLTLEEIPSHRHYGVRRNYAGDSGTHSMGASNGDESTSPYTDYTGGDQPHNNMPPYVAVYIWKRIS